MLENLKTKLQSPRAKQLKEVALNAVAAVAVAVAVKAVTYIAVEGTKALVEEIRNRTTTEETAE